MQEAQEKKMSPTPEAPPPKDGGLLSDSSGSGSTRSHTPEEPSNRLSSPMHIAIIGAGWNGCVTALQLKKEGHHVILIDKNPDIFSGVSGSFGIRGHKGPHYPRSKATREHCLEAYEEFIKVFPETLLLVDRGIYAVGKLDALGRPSLTSWDSFHETFHHLDFQTLDPESQGFNNMEGAMQVQEHCIVLGEKLRAIFREKLARAGIPVYCGETVQAIRRDKVLKKTQLKGLEYLGDFDWVVNATGYQSLIPPTLKTKLPVDMQVFYQPCLALNYQDLSPNPDGKPFSLIVMDGWFPCVMPAQTGQVFDHRYTLTHGCYTIMASCTTPKEAYDCLHAITPSDIATIVTRAEEQICRFFPGFKTRFHYEGWTGSVLAKLKTATEFRSVLTFADDADGVCYIFPGKVSNSIAAGREIGKLIVNRDCLQHGDIRYTKDGVLQGAKKEIDEKPQYPGTCDLDTLNCLQGQLPSASSPYKYDRRIWSSDDLWRSMIPDETSEGEKRPQTSIGCRKHPVGAPTPPIDRSFPSALSFLPPKNSPPPSNIVSIRHGT